MPGVRVVTDSSSDLPPSLAAEHRVTIVPLTIRFGESEFVDGRDLTPREFWARCAASPVLPETAAPAPGAFEQAYRALAAEGADGVVAVCLSAGLSATCQSATIAATAVADTVPVRVIDSRSLTMGLGTMALAAARAAEAGKAIDDVTGVATDLIPRTRIYAALDTLENLRKGGRIGGAQALVGSMLQVKPVIEVRDGAVEQESRQRTRAKSLRYLADKVVADGPVEHLAVMHGDAPDVDDLLDLLADNYRRDEIHVGDIGAVTGAHGGPRVIGVTYCAP